MIEVLGIAKKLSSSVIMESTFKNSILNNFSESSKIENSPGDNCQGGNYVTCSCPGGHCPRIIIWRAIVKGANF